MSLNEEGDEDHLDQLAVARKIQDELVYVIQTSLNNIAGQVNDLNKYAEYLFGELTKEVCMVSFKLKTLQESLNQLTDGITYKVPNERVSLQIRESRKIFRSTAIQTKQVYSSKPLPVKMCETHDACVQTSPLTILAPYFQDETEGLKICPDVSYCFELSEENIISENKEQKGRKCTQKKKHLDYPNEPESVTQSQLMEGNISVAHSPAACGETTYSYVDQPDESSFSTFPLSEISKFPTSTVGKVLYSPLQQQMPRDSDVKNSHTCVNYGTGMGEELQPQPQIHVKTEVFVSPTAPNSPPPLPPDWIVIVRASEKTNPPSIIHSPTQLPSIVFRNQAASSPSDCLQTTLDAAPQITPPEAEFSPLIQEPSQYYEPIPDDLFPQGEDQGIPLPLSPPVTSPRIQSRAAVIDLIDSASVVQSSRSSVFQDAGSSFAKSPRPFLAQSPRSSVPPRVRFSLSPQRYLVPPPSGSSVAPLPRSSTPQTLQDSVPLSSISSDPQTSMSSIPSPRCSVAQSSRCSVAQPSRCSVAQLSRCLDTQSSISPVAQFLRSSFVQPAGHLIPPQPRSPCLKSTKSSTPQSLFSFAQSPSSISSPWALSASQCSSVPVCPGLKESPPSTLPIINKASKALMEAIRKGVLLHKTKDQCVPSQYGDF